MSRDRPLEVITPPNMLKVKVGGPLPAVDAQAIARAQAALEELSGEFGGWIREEIAKMDAALGPVQADGWGGADGDTFYRHVHDLKGLGATYGYPLVTRIATSLCDLIRDKETRAKAPMSIVAAHVSAIKAAVRDGVAPDDPTATALADALEAQVREIAPPETP